MDKLLERFFKWGFYLVMFVVVGHYIGLTQLLIVLLVSVVLGPYVDRAFELLDPRKHARS